MKDNYGVRPMMTINGSSLLVGGDGSSDNPYVFDDIKKAKTLVREQTMPSMMWQKVILDLIEEHPEVSQFLISYLGS